MKHKKILPRHHTGKLVHHRHTAYGYLIVVLLLALVPLLIINQGVVKADPTDPVEGTYSTHAVVPGTAPESAPIITSPAPNSVFDSGDPVTITGRCQSGMLIKVFKNDVLAGAVFCQNGQFNIPIDLFIGINSITARAYNANNIAGPNSLPLNVRRTVAGGGQPDQLTGTDNLFFITSDVQYKGISVGDKLQWPLIISGGQGPYAVSIDWGDGKSDLISRNQAGAFMVDHVYERAGSEFQSSYTIKVQATDGVNAKSSIQLVTIVSGGDTTLVGSIKQGYNWSGTLRTAWQLVLLAIIILISFWLGERREAFILKRKMGMIT